MRTDAWGKGAGVALVALALALGACGDDDGGNTDARTNAGSGGNGNRDGGTPSAGSGGSGTPRTPLPAETAGKECDGDGDCSPGTCATMVQGLDGMQIAAPGGYCMGPCSSSADCGAGGTCVMGFGSMSGLCYAACTMATQATDCREGYLCGPMTSTCRPAPHTDQLDDNVAGDECAAADDCPGGRCDTMRGMTALPGGYCSGACLENGHCGGGGVCRRTGAGAGTCFAACTDDGDCTRDGYRCRDVGGEVMGCNPAPDPLPDNTAGKACTGDADCGGATESCATELPVAMGGTAVAPGGYCSVGCDIDADCGAGGVCVTTLGGGRCFKSCSAMGDCRDGYICGERGQPAMVVCTPEVAEEPDAG